MEIRETIDPCIYETYNMNISFANVYLRLTHVLSRFLSIKKFPYIKLGQHAYVQHFASMFLGYYFFTYQPKKKSVFSITHLFQKVT